MVELKPQMDDYYIARIKYWPTDDFHVIPIQIYFVWKSGEIDFLAFTDNETPIRSTQCAHFELLEKIEVEKYK